jgi:predicted TIM-barrel fold metal-dependent hydrolase
MIVKKFISGDDHVQEHPDVWTKRLSKAKWGDRIPGLKRETDGADYWYVDGRKLGPAARAPLRAQGDGTATPRQWDDVPRAAYVPAERLKAMDLDGVSYSVLYPTVAGLAGETFGHSADPEFELACVQAYNDWLIEEWVNVSDRFIPLCIVPIYPVEAAVAEIERAIAKGHKGVVYPAIPMHLRQVPHINEPEYDRLWQCCQALQVPVCFHAGSSPHVQLSAYDGIRPRLRAALEAVTRPASAVFEVSNFLLSRILLRHPDLKVVFAESSAGWGPFLLEYADHQFEQDRCAGYALKPSEMFKRQCFLTAWYDRLACSVRHVGAENILWATNFPLAGSTWPDSRGFIERCFDGVPDADRRKILWENAARLYRISSLPDNGGPQAEGVGH